MGRILSIDLGRKRCGVAVTDPLRIAAGPLDTVPTGRLCDFVKKYRASEGFDFIVVGQPLDMHGRPSDSTRYITPVLTALRRALPDIEIVPFDERFTSVIAHRAMLDGGLPKMARRDKDTVDRMSATIILNDFLESRQYRLMNDK